MRRFEELPIDPEVLADLDVIDATLAGRIVDDEFAELAELTVIVAAERPQLASDRAVALDERVIGALAPGASRKAGTLASGASRKAGALARGAPRKRRWQWGRPGRWGTVGAVAAALVALFVVVQLPHGGGSSATPSSGSASTSAASKSPAHGVSKSPAHGASKSTSSAGFGAASKSASPAFGGGASGTFAPAPTPSSRKTIQTAQLQLATPGRWVDAVAQEVFDVAGQENAIVRSSQVTAAAGNSGYASFQLSIPTANLGATVTRLSELRHARVASRTDGTVDVNGQYLSDQRRLADARALRTALLKQLAAATTQAQVDSINAQLHDAEASISSDQSALRGLQSQISFSQLSVTINGGTVIVPLVGSSSSSGGFTLGRAAHDAVRVLTVAAGVVLIALAALLPVGLLAALGAWIALSLRRRRREQALDSA